MSKVTLPKGISLGEIAESYQVAATEHSRAMKRVRMLDMADSNRLWEAVQAKFPTYQILPETNHVSYIKNNILASIYIVGKSATLLPTSKEDKEIVTQLNLALEQIWNQIDVPKYQMLAGERAALMNKGITQVGWDNSIVVGSGDTFYKGNCVLKNINPLRYMRDPYAQDIDTAAYAFVWDWYHKSVILANPNYRAAFKEFLVQNMSGISTASATTPDAPTDRNTQSPNGRKGYYKVVTAWVRDDDDKIHEIHTIDNQHVLYVQEDIKPSTIPISELYCNIPSDNLFGSSECNKVFANTVAYNLMNSIILTAEYKNQRPPKFINTQSGLNVASFTKHGNEADRTFIVNGDASKAVHYHQFPQPSASAIGAMGVLANDIKNITGVDDRYTGRDTGSILTTGGIQGMLDQVTMIDAPKIRNYEDYSKRLAKLIISNYITNASLERKYLVKSKKDQKSWESVSVDFPSVPNDILLNYELMISSELPKNKSVIQNTANKLMQMQMQYQGQGVDVDLITPQEWLMFQDFPNKEYMMERMGIQRSTNWTEAVAQIVNQYAGLVEAGMPADKAILATADTMQEQSQPGGGAEQVAQMVQGGGMF